MLDAKTADKIFPEEDSPLIAPNFKAMGASYDMLLALRQKPYTLVQFIQDMADGYVSRSNVEMRRHFVMRNMSEQLGKSVGINAFQTELHEQLLHGAVQLAELHDLDDEVRAVLRLDLVTS